MMMMPHMMYAPPGSYAPYDPMLAAAMANGVRYSVGEDAAAPQQSIGVDE